MLGISTVPWWGMWPTTGPESILQLADRAISTFAAVPRAWLSYVDLYVVSFSYFVLPYGQDSD